MMKFIGGGRRLRKFIFVVLSVSSEKYQIPFEGLHPKKGSRDNVLPVYPCHPSYFTSTWLSRPSTDISSEETPVKAPGRWKSLPCPDCHSTLYKSHSSLPALRTRLDLLDRGTCCRASHQREQ